MTTPTKEASSSSEKEREMYQSSFMAKVQQFMVTNAAAFNALTEQVPSEEAKPHPPHGPNYYGDPVPLEYVMGVSIEKCQQRLLEELSPGDIVRGHVILKTPLALGVQITGLVDSHRARELSGLDVRGLVQYGDLAGEESKCEGVLEEMEVEDCVQAVVVRKQESHIGLSFNPEHLSQSNQDVLLGYQEGEKPAPSMKRPASPSLFLSELERSPGFANPASSENLKAVLRVTGYESETRPSLMRPIQRVEYPKSDYHHALRKVQRHKWSMDTVAVGVKHFKRKELEQAKKLLNHALDIDPNNVEGLVARGALYANNGRYREGIVDFERALTIKHTHSNARKYLVETQIAYGEELEAEGNLERAIVCYQEACADDPSREGAKRRLEVLRNVLQKKAAERAEKERKEAAERARLKKLHSIIKEEKQRKAKKEGPKILKKKKKKKSSYQKKRKKMKKTTSKRRRYSSEEDSFTSDSEYSSSSSSRSYRRKERGSSRPLSRSPPTTKKRRQDSRSPSRTSSTSYSRRHNSRSHSRTRERSSSRSRSRTPRRSKRSLSRSRTPKGRRSLSRSSSRTPRGGRNSRTPRGRRKRSPSRSRSRTPRGRRKRSPSRSRSRTPRGRRKRSPSRSRSRTPRGRRKRSPSRSRSKTPRSAKGRRQSHSSCGSAGRVGKAKSVSTSPVAMDLTRRSLRTIHSSSRNY